MLTSVTLVDGVRSMTLLPRTGLLLQGLDVPFPEVREVAEGRADDDGTDDDTELHGATSCSVELLATRTPGAFVEELGRFLHPRSRPYLVVADDEWAQERRLRLRVAQQSGPLTVELPRTMRRIQAQWKVPDGVWEAVDLAEETVNADYGSSTGLALPVTLPVSLTATTSAGSVMVSNAGNSPAHFVARLYGPCTGPALINDTTGDEISFGTTLVLAAGEYVEIDTRDRAAWWNGDTSNSRLSHLDFAASTWWQLETGDQYLRYAPYSASGAAAAVVTYRPAWIT